MELHISEQALQSEITSKIKLKVKSIFELTDTDLERLKELTLPDGFMKNEVDNAFRHLKTNIYVIAYMRRKIVGWGVLTERSTGTRIRMDGDNPLFYELMIFVDQKHRRQRIGSTILETMTDIVKSTGNTWKVTPHDWGSEQFFKDNSIEAQNVDFFNFMGIENYKELWDATIKRKTGCTNRSNR